MRLKTFIFYKLLSVFILLTYQTIAADQSEIKFSLQNKCQIETIDSGNFCYSYWMATTMADNYGSTAAVRESFAPSAMVDTNGDLYAITLWSFDSKEGPMFAIHKYVAGQLTARTINFYPWEKIPGVTPACTSKPAFDHSEFSGISVGSDLEKNYFKNYIHNVFMPCLAQEVDGESDYLYGFTYIPTTRLMNIQVDQSQYSGAENGGTEGILFFKFKKAGLSLSKTNYVPQTSCRAFQYNFLRPYALSWEHKLQPQFGNFSAYYHNNKIYLYNLCNINDTGTISNSHYTYYNCFSTEGNVISSQTATDAAHHNISNNPKILKLGNYTYFMEIRDGYVPFLKMQSSSNNSIFLKACCFNFIYLETTLQGHSSSTYNFDYHIFDAGEKNIWCVLGFQSSNQYSGLKASEGWASQYFYSMNDASICTKTSLLLWSFPLKKDTSQENFEGKFTESASNYVYSTPVNAHEAIPVTNINSDNLNRLYLNTQKMCVYKNYIIYAYCYPGKSKNSNHLYIGYVPYIITSDARLRLLTKTELKNENDESFIEDCSRIISLDCKNGHVWLTYMNSDNSTYKYFYIKASDLVGE